MKNIKIRSYDIGIYLCIISLYVVPYILRYHFDVYFSAFNILFYIGILIFLMKSKSEKRNTNSKKFIISIFFFSILSLLVFVAQTYSSVPEKIKYIFAYCLPVFLVQSLLYSNNDKLNRFAHILYKSLKFVCAFMVFLWVIDKFYDNAIQKAFLEFYNMPSLYQVFSENRFISFYGHSLTIAILMFSLLLWTLIISDNKLNIKKSFFSIAISIIGIAITGSKSILVLSILLLLVFFTNKKNFKYLIPIVLIVFALYKFGVFDITLSRLSEGLKSGDVSSNRNSSLVKLVNDGTIKFELISGKDINRQSHRMIAALEYPILRWAYYNGIIFSLILSFLYFIRPLNMYLKNRNIKMFLGILIYILAVNIEDGLASNPDAILIFVLNICLINYISLAKNLDKNEIENKEVKLIE